MNNINQKNTVLSFNENNSLPYGEYDVKYQNGTTIDSINLNNTFNQLVENDLYIEKQLTFLSNYQVGPKVFDSSISTTQVDGYKYWVGLDKDANLSILHKVNEELSNTLDVVYSNGSPITGNVHYLIGFSGKYFAGVDDVILTSNNGKVWESYADSKSLTYYRDNEKLILPFDNDIKLLSTNSNDQIQFVKINQSSFDGEHPTAINIDEDNNIYVGTDVGKIWNATYGQYSDLLSGIEFHQTQMPTDPSDDVRDIVFRSKNEQFTDVNYIMASLSSGIFESGYARELRDKNIVSSDTGVIIYDACVYNYILYVATSNGLYTFNQNGFNIIKSITTPVFALQKYGSGSSQTLLLLQKDSNTNFLQVYDLKNNVVVISGEVVIPDSEQPNDFEYFVSGEERVFVYSTNQGLYCKVENPNDNTSVISTILTADVRQIKASRTNNLVMIYTSVVKDGTSKFQVYSLSKQNGKYIIDTVDYNDFEGFDQISSITNSQCNNFVKYHNKFVYVDGMSLKSLDGKLNIPVDDGDGCNNLSILEYIDTGTFLPDKGLIVSYLNGDSQTQKLRFVNQIYNSVHDIELDGAIELPIKNVVFGTNYVYVVTNNNVYICTFEICNMFEENETYKLHVKGSSQFSNIKTGLNVHGNFCILNENKLTNLSVDTECEFKPIGYNMYDTTGSIIHHEEVLSVSHIKGNVEDGKYFAIRRINASSANLEYYEYVNDSYMVGLKRKTSQQYEIGNKDIDIFTCKTEDELHRTLTNIVLFDGSKVDCRLTDGTIVSVGLPENGYMNSFTMVGNVPVYSATIPNTNETGTFVGTVTPSKYKIIGDYNISGCNILSARDFYKDVNYDEQEEPPTDISSYFVACASCDYRSLDYPAMEFRVILDTVSGLTNWPQKTFKDIPALISLSIENEHFDGNNVSSISRLNVDNVDILFNGGNLYTSYKVTEDLSVYKDLSIEVSVICISALSTSSPCKWIVNAKGCGDNILSSISCGTYDDIWSYIEYMSPLSDNYLSDTWDYNSDTNTVSVIYSISPSTSEYQNYFGYPRDWPIVKGRQHTKTYKKYLGDRFWFSSPKLSVQQQDIEMYNQINARYSEKPPVEFGSVIHTTSSDTHIYGIHDIGDVYQMAAGENHCSISSGMFFKMYPLVGGHVALYDAVENKVFIDDYEYEQWDHEGGIDNVAKSGSPVELYTLTNGYVVKDIKSYSIDSDVNVDSDDSENELNGTKSIVAILVGSDTDSKIITKEYWVGEYYINDTNRSYYLPSKLTKIENISELTGPANINKIAIKSYHGNTMSLYSLSDDNNLFYDKEIPVGSNFARGGVVQSDVKDIISDCKHNYSYKVIKNPDGENNNIQIVPFDDENPIFMNSDIPFDNYSPNMAIGIGNTNINNNPYGFILLSSFGYINGSTPMWCNDFEVFDVPLNASKLNDSYQIAQDKVYNKLRENNGIIFALSGGVLLATNNYTITDFPNTLNPIPQLTGIEDFEVLNDKIFYVKSNRPNSIYVGQLDTAHLSVREDERLDTNGHVYNLTIVDNNWKTASLSDNTPLLNIAFSHKEPSGTEGGQNSSLSVVHAQYPYFTSGVKVQDVDDIFKNNENNYYIHKTDDTIYQLPSDFWPSAIVTGATSLIPANIGFAFTSAANTIDVYKDDTHRYHLSTDDNIYGIWHQQNDFYGINDKHIYKSKYAIDHNVDITNKLTEDLSVFQIDTINNSLDVYLVAKDQSSSKYNYKIYRSYQNLCFDMNVAGTDGTQSFEQAMIINDATGGFIRFIYDGHSGTDYRIYHGVGEGVVQKWFVDAELGCVAKKGFLVNGRYYILTQDNQILTFTGYDPTIRKFEKITYRNLDNIDPGKFIDLGGNKFLLATKTGVFYINNDVFVKISNNFSIGTLKYINQTTGTRLLFTLSNDVRTTDNYKKITDKSDRLLELSSAVSCVNDVMRLNDYDFVFATDKGMYATNYTYTLQNDLTYFTERQVNQIYNYLLSGQMTNEISNAISAHEAEYHNNKSLITRINQSIQDPYLSKTPSTWTYIDGDNYNSVISNDMISTVYFGNDKTGGISVLTHNFLGDGTPEFDSIEKKYHSGLTELYILVDTTNTYYINHISGAGYSSPSNNSYVRKNLEQFGAEKASVSCSSNALNELKTSISVIFDTSKYDIDNMMEIHINGCSLPLKIYGDLDGDADRSRAEILNMYQSLIVPSRLLVKMKNDDNVGLLVFSCFGTDQQSIKLSFWQTNSP